VDILATAAGRNGGSPLCLLGPHELERFLKVLHQQGEVPSQTDVQHNVAVLGIVGDRVAMAPGVLACVARCLEKIGLEPLAVLQDASPYGIVIALPDDEPRLLAALRLLHTELGLDRRN
jgi:hypothetical protein